jgi:phosphoserine phosphatase RsbU/P
MWERDGAGAAGATTAVPAEEIAHVLARHPTFARFDHASLIAVAAHCRLDSFEPGATIMRQGEFGGFAYMILQGEAEVFVEIPPGSIRMATLGEHRVVGELGAFTEMPRTATVVARTRLVALRIERDSLMSLSANYPEIPFAIIAELGRRLHSMNRPLAYLTYAAMALARDEYDADLLAELVDQHDDLSNFARVFAEMAAEIRDKQARRLELMAAADIQRSILPGPLPRTGATAVVDLHAEMHPARELGGDFYDYFPIGERRLAFTMADVAGKGIPAALFMAVSRTLLRSLTDDTDIAARINHANRLLSAENEACMFVTVVHCVLDLATGQLRYCNAGHNPPYVLRADGQREALGATGIPLGIDSAVDYRIGEVQLQPGDGLFLFTDGVTEALDPAGVEFGTPDLEAALAERNWASAASLVAHVLHETARHAAGAEQSDDITCLALFYRP